MKFLYFGTKDYMQKLAPPAVGYGNTAAGWASSIEYMNGGVGIRNSRATHKEYNYVWKLERREALRPIMDYYSGMYGAGPFYFIDPFEADQNVLPRQWAFPGQAGYDAPILVGDKRPTITATAVNSNGYPSTTATYGTGDKRKLFIPIPPGHSAWVGVHGPTSTGKLTVSPVISTLNIAPAVPLTNIPVTSTTRYNTSFNGDNYIGIEVSLQDNTTYTGAMVQIHPNGITPPDGPFISGQGNSGCYFDEAPMQTPYSAALDRVSMTASLKEVVDWL